MYSTRRLGWVGVWGMVLTGSVTWAADIGTAFTYQGSLEDGSGPVTGTCDFVFQLYDAAAGGNLKGTNPQAKPGVAVDAGVFTVNDLDFGALGIDGTARWLEISVCCPSPCAPTLLSPRVKLTPAPHALALPGLYTQQTGASPNLIGGYSGNSVGPSVIGATISGGGGSGSVNSATEHYATVGGGLGNTASGGGGLGFCLCGEDCFSDSDCLIFCGFPNPCIRGVATVGGGGANTASGSASTVGGGGLNTASGSHSTVGGGFGNTASGNLSSVSGYRNIASGDQSTVGGGLQNIAGRSCMGGGLTYFPCDSDADCPFSATCPTATGYVATVGGGIYNNAGADQSTVGGGGLNTASGSHSTVPGGSSNVAGGDFSFAAGYRAHVRDAAMVGGGDTDGDEGSFVWADSTNDTFTSTGPNQFLVRASGGVGIGTTTPSGKLHISSSGNDQIILSHPTTAGFPQISFQTTAGVNDSSISYDQANDLLYLANGLAARLLVGNSGLVGIGRVAVTNRLEVEGDASKTTGGLWNFNSDAAIKTNVRRIDNALAVIDRLRPVAFRYTDEYKGEHPSVENHDYYNYIAQEFEKVFPDSVKTDGGGLLQMDPYPASVYAVAAIQELHHIVQDKDCRIEELETRVKSVEQLEAKLASLEALVAKLAEQSNGGGR